MTPGEISNVELMELAKKYIRPDLKWQTFGLDEMLSSLKAPRANCILDGSKLQNKLREYSYEVKERHEAADEIFHVLAEKGL